MNALLAWWTVLVVVAPFLLLLPPLLHDPVLDRLAVVGKEALVLLVQFLLE